MAPCVSLFLILQEVAVVHRLRLETHESAVGHGSQVAGWRPMDHIGQHSLRWTLTAAEVHCRAHHWQNDAFRQMALPSHLRRRPLVRRQLHQFLLQWHLTLDAPAEHPRSRWIPGLIHE